jgi:hypothetical protein
MTMGRVKRALVIAVAVIAFLAVSVVVARWLSADTDERGQVVDLLRAQSRGDAPAMLRMLDDCRDPACVATVRANARRLRGHGELKVALYQSGTAHVLRGRTKQTRVVWFTPGRLTTVQCVLVRRTGNVLAGVSVSLLRLSAPIGRESGCT